MRAKQRKRDERKGRKAAGERSSRRLSCDHRGVPSPEKEPQVRESERMKTREREREGEKEVQVGETEKESRGT